MAYDKVVLIEILVDYNLLTFFFKKFFINQEV